MPCYNSSFTDSSYKNVGNMAVLPLKTNQKGPAPKLTSGDDIIDEAFKYFRANVFFKQFNIKSPADRVLIYATLFIHACIVATQKSSNKNDAKKTLNTLALARFSIPGDPKFPLNALFSTPKGSDGDTMKQYLQQIRLEISERFVNVAFKNELPDKWWMCFSKRKFMNATID